MGRGRASYIKDIFLAEKNLRHLWRSSSILPLFSERDIISALDLMDNKNALAVMARAPRPGNVKTRITSLTIEEKASLYRAFITDTFNRIKNLGGVDIFSFYTPRSGRDEISKDIPYRVFLTAQKGRDLGERLFNVFFSLFRRGYERVAVIGSDSPSLPPEYVQEAFSILKGSETLVLGPAKDGGYYLVAMDRVSFKRAGKTLFSGIPWGSPMVLKETVKRAKANNTALKLLKRWYDIDTKEDLYLLKDNKDAPVSSGYLKKIGFFREGGKPPL